MRKITLVFIAFLVMGCKSEDKKQQDEPPLSIAKKIANAHGLEKWDKVNSIAFTFNVDRDSSHYERSWKWWPKTDEVLSVQGSDSLIYKRADMDSLAVARDRGFINDKFWLMVPFQLVWDEGTTISAAEQANAPLSDITMNKITITYSEGGYTPGDAYDIYFDEGYEIQEWVFRKGNSPEPSLITSFENYKDYEGIRFALVHRKKGEEWNLHFTNIAVEMEE